MQGCCSFSAGAVCQGANQSQSTVYCQPEQAVGKASGPFERVGERMLVTWGSDVSSVQARSTLPGAAKQAKLSTCPLVSSSAYRPLGSQMIFRTPSMSLRWPSIWDLLSWGLRVLPVVLSRHSSVVSRVLHLSMLWSQRQTCEQSPPPSLLPLTPLTQGAKAQPRSRRCLPVIEDGGACKSPFFMCSRQSAAANSRLQENMSKGKWAELRQKICTAPDSMLKSHFQAACSCPPAPPPFFLGRC